MRDYLIMTDSCCDLPDALVRELGIIVLPLSFNMEGKEYYNYPDNRDMDPHVFYDKVRAGIMGTTSAVSVGMFQAKMASLVETTGKDILCIAFSSALSATYQSASIAAKDVEESHPGATVRVVDSRAASMGQGMLVYQAVQEQKRGRSLEDVARFVEERRDRLDHWFTVDDLGHLKRGGRVSAAAAFFGTMLQMKPVLHVDNEGRLIPMDKVRGRKASIQALLEKMEELVEDPSLVFISHGDCLDEAEELGRAIQAKFPVQRMVYNHVGPVIGNHTGAGVIALFFVGKNK